MRECFSEVKRKFRFVSIALQLCDKCVVNCLVVSAFKERVLCCFLNTWSAVWTVGYVDFLDRSEMSIKGGMAYSELYDNSYWRCGQFLCCFQIGW